MARSQVTNGAAGIVRLRLQGATRHLLDVVKRATIDPGVVAAAAGLVGLGLFVQRRMALLQALPLRDLLVEAEVAPRAAAPLVVARQAEAAVVEQALHVGDAYAVVL